MKIEIPLLGNPCIRLDTKSFANSGFKEIFVPCVDVNAENKGLCAEIAAVDSTWAGGAESDI